MSHRAGEVPWENWALFIAFSWLTLCGLMVMRMAAIEGARPRMAPPAVQHKPARVDLERMEDNDDGRVNTARCCG